MNKKFKALFFIVSFSFFAGSCSYMISELADNNQDIVQNHEQNNQQEETNNQQRQNNNQEQGTNQQEQNNNQEQQEENQQQEDNNQELQNNNQQEQNQNKPEDPPPADETEVYYTITLDLEGGSFQPGATIPLSITQKAGTPLEIPDPQKQGYIFCGWNKIGGGIPETMTKDGTYKAYWILDSSIPKYIVSYSSEYGTAPESFIAQEGTTITPSMLPELSALGKIFKGWYVDDTKIIENEYTIQSNICITAKWINRKPIYTVKHWQESEDENSEPVLADEEIFEGNAGSYTMAEPKNYEGFYSGQITQKIINANNTTTVDIYYFRKDKTNNIINGFEIELQNNGNIALSSQIQNNALIITAEQGFENYTWLLDTREPDGNTEIVSQVTPCIFTISDFSQRQAGVYIINVIASKNNIDYSGILIVTKE